MSLNSLEIHNALNEMGYEIEPERKHPAHAYEHYLGNDKYLYVKRSNKCPLVLAPSNVDNKQLIDEICGISVNWGTISKNSNFRKYPKHPTASSKYGHDVDVESISALRDLVSLLTGNTGYQPMPIEVQEIIDVSTTKPTQPLNQILFGPPGTGKTYHTVINALEIVEPEHPSLSANDYEGMKQRYDELVESGQIGFVTFHQSFSYEDFVEGLRADTDDKGNICYQIQNGVFKQLCDDASAKVTKESDVVGADYSKAAIWKMSLGETNNAADEEIFSDCVDNDRVLLGYGGQIDFSDCDTASKIKNKYLEAFPNEDSSFGYNVVHRFKHEMKQGDLILVSDGNSRFRGIAQVTGEYQKVDDEERTRYCQGRAVKWIKVFENSRKVKDIYQSNFQMKALYKMNLGKLKQDEFKSILTTNSEEASHKPYVLIIDEINRGNISRIFGELITLIEASKRDGAKDAQTITLPYSKKPFCVPDNVYIIGTMNTADRSLAQLDIALRRRFEFNEMMPDVSLLAGIEVEGISIDVLLKIINARIEALLDREHTIGHSYFLPLKEQGTNTLSNLSTIFKKQIIPLLQEYFFDDWERIRWVLNDHRKSNLQYQFIASNLNYELSDLFGSEVSEQIHNKPWNINTDAFKYQQSYAQIVQAFEAQQLKTSNEEQEFVL